MRDNKKKMVLILVLIFIFSATAAVGAQGRINDMNFKNADLTDVLRAIAEVADVNLITDSTVSGTVTVHLKDITFVKALDLITQTRSLTYKWDENTVVVAPPDRIDEIYANIVTKFVKVNSNDLENISVIVKDIFPETQITVDPVRRQFILKGEDSRVAEITEMINRLDSAAVVQENKEKKLEEAKKEETEEKIEKSYSESYEVLNAELSDLADKLKQVNSELQVNVNSLTGDVTVSGEESDVKRAISMAATYDKSLEPETRFVRVDYVDTEQINEIVEKLYPNIKLHVNQKRKEIIINGAKNKLDSVVQLVNEINKPRHQVIIEARVEEVSTSKLEELGIQGDLSRIHFIKDTPGENESPQIEGIELTWPDFFTALNRDSDSKTLANPRLMTLNGEDAKMLIGQRIPVRVYDEAEDTTSIKYIEAGITLEFTPWITENNEIELDISPKVSSLGEELYEGFPAIRTREISTRLRLNNGETFAIGGLIQEDDTKTIRKVPILGDIPILGEIFKYRNNDNTRNELIIFITPRIIKYGENNRNEDHLINSDLNSVDQNRENNSNNEDESAEISSENKKSRDEILSQFKDDDKKEKEFNDLSPEELEEILNKN